MARLHEEDGSGDELPELSTIMASYGKSLLKEPLSAKTPGKASKKEQEDGKYRFQAPAGFTGPSCDERQSRKQRPLSVSLVNSLLLPISDSLTKSPNQKFSDPKNLTCKRAVRSTPRRTIKPALEYNASSSTDGDTSDSETAATFDDLSDFIVDDSTTDAEAQPIQPTRSSKKLHRRSRKEPRLGPEKSLSTANNQSFVERIRYPTVVDLTSPTRDSSVPNSANAAIEPTSVPLDQAPFADPFDENPFAQIRFSPPRSKTPHKLITPPSSPSKSKSQSPSKSHRIPPSPHRPSIDAFWSQEIINEWNDQYSPTKTPKSRHAGHLYPLEEDSEADIPLPLSPRKSLVKKDKEALQRHKAFNEKKQSLATSFLKELDEALTKGQVASLAASAGGIRIIWSKKLSSTAGRANWKRETVRSKSANGSITDTTHRHHASIELAEKVIDDEDRLVNVLAHEYCHLANFMISNIKDQPHGPSFKQWAQKATLAFPHRSITVTTKHAYTISYKYTWTCTNALCAHQYNRHSKSIDPTRHSCGACKSKLVQVRPVPRAMGTATAGGKVSAYQEFVREHYGRVVRENAGLGMGEVMGILGREFREGKRGGRGEMDSVARKLDFLSLGG